MYHYLQRCLTTMYSSEEEWSTASSDQEVGPLGDESSGDDNGSHHHLAENTPATARYVD